MDKFTRYGKFMYTLTMNWTKFLVQHKILYYILSCTWGLLLTIFGAVITAVLFCLTTSTTIPYYWIYYMQIGNYWGGFETGLMFVCEHDTTESLRAHEFGHTFQNTLFGPLNIFLTSIPSAIRYWIREIQTRHGHEPTTDYDDIWFEKSATDCGQYAVQFIKEHK